MVTDMTQLCEDLKKELVEGGYTSVKVHRDGAYNSSEQVFVSVGEAGVSSKTLAGYFDLIFGVGKWDMDFGNRARGAEIRVGVASQDLDPWSRRLGQGVSLAMQGCCVVILVVLAMLVTSDENEPGAPK